MTKKELSPKQKATDMLRTSHRVAIVASSSSKSNYYAALGLCVFLDTYGKRATVVTEQDSGASAIIKENIEQIGEIVVENSYEVTIKPASAQLGSLAYHKIEGGVVLEVSAQYGEMSVDDVTVQLMSNNFDLFVLIGAPLDHSSYQGKKVLMLDTQKAVFFENATSYNDPQATCVGEMLVSIFEALEKSALDADVATALYASIVSATDRFQNHLTTPRAMTMAAQLLASGARRESVLSTLFEYESKEMESLVKPPILAGPEIVSQPNISVEPQVVAPLAESELDDSWFAPIVPDIEETVPVITDSAPAATGGLLGRLMQERKVARDKLDFDLLEGAIEQKKEVEAGDFDPSLSL